jgi:molybdopterin-guanine dinucleotide biosynthesis protein A
VPGCGPLGGILTALETTTSEMNLIAAVDLPLLTPEFLKWFCARLAATSKLVLACAIGRNFPLCLGIHRDARSQVSEFS